MHWKEAVVVVIPKPGKTDYSVAKAHRPISLLETMSKLLEKAVAKRFQYDIVKEELIPTNQFGGRTHSSCLDTGITLIHDVQAAHAAGLKAGFLLFDVKGFFDNVNHAHMTARLADMGFAPELVKWASGFLADRRIHLQFNNVTSEERTQPVGIPQGSPLSPVLSIAYTAPLLDKMKHWCNDPLIVLPDLGVGGS
jgi:retron-type reverse transcriptase